MFNKGGYVAYVTLIMILLSKEMQAKPCFDD